MQIEGPSRTELGQCADLERLGLESAVWIIRASHERVTIVRSAVTAQDVVRESSGIGEGGIPVLGVVRVVREHAAQRRSRPVYRDADTIPWVGDGVSHALDE